MTFALLFAGGLALVPYAVRLVAAALGHDFSPFAYLGLPEDPGWHVLFFAALIAVCFFLLDLLLRQARAELWLAGRDGGTLVPTHAVGALLRDAALQHVEVVTADVDVRVRGGRPAATLAVSLRPLVDGETVAADLAASTRELLARVTGLAAVDVRVRQRVLSVKQLAGRLP